MRIRPVIQAIFLVAAGTVAGYWLGHHPPPGRPQAITLEQSAFERLPDVDINSITFRDMARYAQRAHPQFIADWTSMAQDNISPDDVVMLDLHLHHPTLEQLLAKLSVPMNPARPRVGFSIESYELIMEGGGSGERPSYGFRRFDVRDLLNTDGPWEKLAYIAEENSARFVTHNSRAYRYELLVATLKHVVDPASWELSHGSLVGEIQIDRGTLDISQSDQNNDLIGEVLKILRQAR